MTLYDISQEVFSCCVYPGDPVPQLQQLLRMEEGGLYNLSAFHMGTHNGTHVDAPAHFISGGKTISQIPLETFVGQAFVVSHKGLITKDDAEHILQQANLIPRILLKGESAVTQDAAKVFAQAGILLLGAESQSIGPVAAPMAVHKILLQADVVLLEGIRLQQVPDGFYLLHAAPLNLAGAEGAPCRATLMSL